jgi:DNA-directed RNA polymerase subunit RPC12/RpoP
MSKFEIRKEGDTYFVLGHMNEATDFGPLLESPDAPLKVNLEGVTNINSVGSKALMNLVRNPGSRELQLLEVPSFLVTMFNVVPALIGKRAKSVHSLFVPYHCADCGKTVEMLIKREEVRMTNRGTHAPARRCERCNAAMKLRGEEEDMFLFLTYSA